MFLQILYIWGTAPLISNNNRTVETLTLCLHVLHHTADEEGTFTGLGDCSY